MSASRLTIARRCASPSTTVVSPKGAAPRHTHRARHRARRPLHSSSGPLCTCCEWRPPSFGKRTAAAGVGAHRAASRADRAVWGLARSVHSARTRYRRSWRPTPVVDGRVSCVNIGMARRGLRPCTCRQGRGMHKAALSLILLQSCSRRRVNVNGTARGAHAFDACMHLHSADELVTCLAQQ